MAKCPPGKLKVMSAIPGTKKKKRERERKANIHQLPGSRVGGHAEGSALVASCQIRQHLGGTSPWSDSKGAVACVTAPFRAAQSQSLQKPGRQEASMEPPPWEDRLWSAARGGRGPAGPSGCGA